jgi:hypothetical protein
LCRRFGKNDADSSLVEPAGGVGPANPAAQDARQPFDAGGDGFFPRRNDHQGKNAVTSVDTHSFELERRLKSFAVQQPGTISLHCSTAGAGKNPV